MKKGFLLFGFLLMASFSVQGQPVQFDIINCFDFVNGTYIRGEDHAGCACFENQSNDYVLSYSSGNNAWAIQLTDDGTCTGEFLPQGGTLLNETNGDCDPSNNANSGDIINCGGAFVNVIYPAIPTMSQWALILFGLLILNLGLVFVYRRQLTR